jgi:osmotically-inducible protein OsmY
MKTSRYFSPMAWIFAILLAAGCASGPNTASTGETIDDTVITARVKAALVKDPELSASEIKVETFKGVVQLSGFVSDTSDIPKATQVASNIPGVESVRNDIIAR